VSPFNLICRLDEKRGGEDIITLDLTNRLCEPVKGNCTGFKGRGEGPGESMEKGGRV